MTKVHSQDPSSPRKLNGPTILITPRSLSVSQPVRTTETCQRPPSSPELLQPLPLPRARFSPKLLLLLAWACIAFGPWLLQIKSYVQLMIPHKVPQDLIVHSDEPQLIQDIEEHCPVVELNIAGAFWNVYPTHYFPSRWSEGGFICAFVVQQYNVFGHYHLHNGSDADSPRLRGEHSSSASCADEGFAMDYYFYHGSVGFYSYYEEGEGIYCPNDRTGYVIVGKLGTADINGQTLAKDRGGTKGEYRQSNYYEVVEAIWILFRALVVRRSLAACQRFGRQCEALGETLNLTNALVFAQESARLTAHHANNFQRALILYFLVESLMADLFFLIAKDGLFAKLQYFSLGYNLAGFISVAFEVIESRKSIPPHALRVTKRLLFNFETALMGESVCAAIVHHYLTALNRSDFKRSIRAAEAVSYYVWGLVGHLTIVIGLLSTIFATRIILSVAIVRVKHGSLRLFTEPCSVDTLLGVKQKTITLSGYVWHHGRLLYNVRALKSFGLMRAVDWEHAEFLVHYRVDWFSLSKRRSFEVVGKLRGATLKRCSEEEGAHIEAAAGIVTMCEYAIGAAAGP
jgi:hypothetical protein